MTRLRPAADVAWTEDADTDEPVVALGRVPDGQPILLRDVSALIWLLLVETEDPVVVAADLRDAFPQIPPAEVDGSVRAFVDDLVARGLLVEIPQSERSPDSTSETR
ncbi:hypothetical protein GCM10027425_03210 [Alteromonas gracilis]